MKNYKEMAESVLERRDRYADDRKRIIWKTASVVSCFCLIAVLGTGIWYAGILNNDLDISNGDVVDGRYQNKEAQAGGVLPGGATIGNTRDDGADIKKDKQEPAGEERDGNSVEYPSLTTDMPHRSDGISESDPMDTDDEIYRDKPLQHNPGNTGALTKYEDVWGGSYMDDAGRWVVLLTENTAENQEKVFQLNPTLTEDNTVFKDAAYSHSYLMNLMKRLSKAELPQVVSSIGFREERNRIEVIMAADDADAMAEILAFDTIGGAIEIICLSELQIDQNVIK